MPHQLGASVPVACFVVALVRSSVSFRPEVIYVREKGKKVASDKSFVDETIPTVAGLSVTAGTSRTDGALAMRRRWPNDTFAKKAWGTRTDRAAVVSKIWRNDTLLSKVREERAGSFSAKRVAHEYAADASMAHVEMQLAQAVKAIVGSSPPLSVASLSGSSVLGKAACHEGDGGRRVGCEGGCACQWYEQCFAKRRSGQPLEDSGVCEMSMLLAAVLTVTFELCLLVITVVLRLALQHREFLRYALERRPTVPTMTPLSQEAEQRRGFQQYGRKKLRGATS